MPPACASLALTVVLILATLYSVLEILSIVNRGGRYLISSRRAVKTYRCDGPSAPPRGVTRSSWQPPRGEVIVMRLRGVSGYPAV